MTATALLGPGARAEVDVAAVRRVRARTRAWHRRVIGGLSILLFAVFAARVLLGDYTVTIPDFFRILTGTDIPGASYIVMEAKLPRAVLGVLVGVAFGVSGAIFQTALRNPLASPDIIGISLGASAAAVVAIVLSGCRARRSPWSPCSARSGSRWESGWSRAAAPGTSWC